MATVVETEVTLYAFCPDGACAGYATEPVTGINRETMITFFDQGSPNMPGVSHSYSHYIVPVGKDDQGNLIPDPLPCPACGKDRHLSPTERPQYSRMNPQDPQTLLHLGKTEDRIRDGELQDARQRAELAELRAQIAQLSAALEKNTNTKAA